MGPCAKATTLRGGPRWKKVFKWCLNILAAQRKIKQNLATCTSMNLHLWPHHSISPPNQKKTHKSAGRPMPSAISTSSDFSNYKIAPRKEIQFRISTKNSNNCLSTSPKLQNTNNSTTLQTRRRRSTSTYFGTYSIKIIGCCPWGLLISRMVLNRA